MARESAADKAARLAREADERAKKNQPTSGDGAAAGAAGGDEGAGAAGAGDTGAAGTDGGDQGDQGGDGDGDGGDLGDGPVDAVDLTKPLPPPAAPPAAPAKAAVVEEAPLRVLKPNTGGITERSIEVLLDACERYGIDPRADLPQYQPGKSRGNGPWRQLAAWSFYEGDERGGVPDAVVIVTEGGVKLKHYADPAYPMDQDTADRLRRIFRLYEQDAKTREIRELPMPHDLALPAESLDGVVRTTEHQYRGGYLKSGGAEAAGKKKRPQVIGV